MFYYFLYPCSVPWYLSLVLKIYGIQVQVLGTPTREEIKCMNPNYTEFKFPQIKAHPWHKVIERYFFLSVYAHYFIVIFIYIYEPSSSDLSQAYATWSCGSRVKTTTILSKSSMHSCEYLFFSRCVRALKTFHILLNTLYFHDHLWLLLMA